MLYRLKLQIVARFNGGSANICHDTSLSCSIFSALSAPPTLSTTPFSLARPVERGPWLPVGRTPPPAPPFGQGRR